MRRYFAVACACAALIAVPALTALASTKKGIGLSTRDPMWARKVSEAKVGWVYTWGSDLPADLPAGVEFVPMIWGRNDYRSMNVPSGSKELLGFNEPDMQDQAKMPVDEVVADWPALEKTGLPLGSPAPAWWNDRWMTDFMAEAVQKNLRIDFICVHWYNTPDPKKFLDLIDQVHSTYHKPIWITEFAVGVFQPNPPTYTPQQVQDFMKAVLPELERRDYVQRYAWFPSKPGSKRLGASALYNPDGSLTDLGNIYASY